MAFDRYGQRISIHLLSCCAVVLFFMGTICPFTDTSCITIPDSEYKRCFANETLQYRSPPLDIKNQKEDNTSEEPSLDLKTASAVFSSTKLEKTREDYFYENLSGAVLRAT